MQDLIIIGILAVVVVVGVISTMNHFKGKSGCCGGGEEKTGADFEDEIKSKERISKYIK